MLIIFVYGCSSCGVNAEHVRRVKRYAIANGFEVEIKNTRYNKEAAQDHLRFLFEELDIKGNYAPIVYHDGKVTLLKDFANTWNS